MSVKKFGIAILIFAFSFQNRTSGQEVGLQFNGGLMNYGGDLQQNSYSYKLSHFTVGGDLLFRVNHFVIRAGFSLGEISGDDKQGTIYSHRNLNFTSNITEGRLCLEYDLFELDEIHYFTPYVYAGVGVFHFNPYTSYNNTKVYLQPLGTEGQGLAIYPNRKFYSLTQINNPLGIGVKFRVSQRLVVGLEFSSRLLFTDYLDDVSTTYPDQTELFKARGQLPVDLSYRGDELYPGTPFPTGDVRGHPNQNDNYYSSILTFTYLLHHVSYGHLSSGNNIGKSSGKHRGHISCPKVH